jgi:hypothetical protein
MDPFSTTTAAAVGHAAEHAATNVVEGASGFLRAICMPAALEYGELLRDTVRVWRAENLAATLLKAEKRLAARMAKETVAIHPRLLAAVINDASLTDDDLLQEFWAGLIASSCTSTGREETNLVFTRLMAQLTAAQAQILKLACEGATKVRSASGLIMVNRGHFVTVEQLVEVSGVTDIHHLDIELDALRELGVIGGGFGLAGGEEKRPDLTPTPLGLNLYVRCQGYVGSALDYFGVSASVPGHQVS